MANYFVGIEGVGGKIYFDETGFLFKSHSFNIQTGQMRINYKDIAKLGKWNSLVIVPNGLSVFTRDGIEHKFVIYHRNDVFEFLESKISEQA